MALIGTLINRLLKSGSITIVEPDGSRETYGPGGGKSLTVRVADRKVAFELMRSPRLAVGEAYMDERLVIEDGTILDLLEIVTASSRWEDGGKGRKFLGKGRFKAFKAVIRRNDPRKSPTITTSAMRSTSSSSTTTFSTAALITPIRPTASSKRRPTRKRISPPSSI